jgi:hypothetical protein
MPHMDTEIFQKLKKEYIFQKKRLPFTIKQVAAAFVKRCHHLKFQTFLIYQKNLNLWAFQYTLSVSSFTSTKNNLQTHL